MQCPLLLAFVLVCAQLTTGLVLVPNPYRRSRLQSTVSGFTQSVQTWPRFSLLSYNDAMEETLLEPKLNEDRTKSLFAWISLAVMGIEPYDDLELGLEAVIGNLEDHSAPVQMLQQALAVLPDGEEERCGPPYSLQERQLESLGPLGAGQWSGQSDLIFAHSLLDVSNLTSLDKWESGLPRTCRQTMRRGQKAASCGNFTVTVLPVQGDEAAPHSSLAHFRVVMEHTMRLLDRHSLDYSSDQFFDALCEGIERFVLSTRMAGTIHEYRNKQGNIIGVFHKVCKGKTVRGQWFFSSNEAAKSFVWFHSVRELVKEAIEDDRSRVVDLGPNGADGRLDAHAQLKSRYGFALVDDWPAVSDYRGRFW